MCKLLLNIVPNVYNSLQSSYLSLVWPWPGRSLPKGEPVGVLGPWTWAQCGQAPSPPATSNAPPNPCTPCWPPNAPTPLGSPNAPWCHPYPCWLLSTYSLPAPIPLNTPTPADGPQYPNAPIPLGASQCPLMPLVPPWPLGTYTLCQLPMQSWHPYIPDGPPDLLDTPTPLEAPNVPDATYTPAGPWVPTLPTRPQCTLTLLHPWWPQCPLDTPTPPRSPQCPDATYSPASPEHLHSLPSPNAPLTPPTSLMAPCCPDTHASFQLLSLCNWPSSWVCPVKNIPSCFQLLSLC